MQHRVVVAGAGPTGLMVAHRLKQKQIKALVVGKGKNGMLMPVEISGKRVNIVPITPKRGSKLSAALDLAKWSRNNLKFTFLNEGMNLDILFSRASAKSFFRHANNTFGPRAAGLGYKLVGKPTLKHRLPLLEAKIDRAYILGQRNNELIGFNDGISAYLNFIEGISGEILHEPIGMVRVDLKRKILETDAGEVSYKTLVWTAPLPELLTKCGLEGAIKFISCGAAFDVYESISGGLDENQVYYDCDPFSSIYRVFVPNNSTIVVQRSLGWEGTTGHEIHRLENIVPRAENVEYKFSKEYELAYPLGSEDGSMSMADLLGELERQDIIPFGRFGRWEYLDLDDHKWELVDAAIDDF